MAWWKYVPGEAWQHGHRASLIPLLVLFTARFEKNKVIDLVLMVILKFKGQMLQ